jgi:signal transduction histidine kinase
VLNLLVNALDALEERGGGTVVVALGRRGDDLELSVADDGPGVRAEDLPRISDLFFTTKEVGKGTGLGLALVHGVAASHGGRVELESSPGAGFRATIVLPAWKGSAAGAG